MRIRSFLNMTFVLLLLSSCGSQEVLTSGGAIGGESGNSASDEVQQPVVGTNNPDNTIDVGPEGETTVKETEKTPEKEVAKTPQKGF